MLPGRLVVVLLRDHRAEVFGAEPASAAACAETRDMILAHLTRVRPEWFERAGGSVFACLTGEQYDICAHDPLELAGRLVQEDLCLIEASAEGPRLTAAILCFPSRWRLHEKLGRPLSIVHGAVPLYAEKLARPVDRFMDRVRPDHIAIRINWSLMDDPVLFQPTGKWRTDRNETIDANNAGERLFLRVERQSFRRLPVSGAVLFGIRVHVYPLSRVIATPSLAARLACAVRALPTAMAQYKSLPMFQDALLAWLERRAGGPPGEQ